MAFCVVSVADPLPNATDGRKSEVIKQGKMSAERMFNEQLATTTKKLFPKWKKEEELCMAVMVKLCQLSLTAHFREKISRLL